LRKYFLGTKELELFSHLVATQKKVQVEDLAPVWTISVIVSYFFASQTDLKSVRQTPSSSRPSKEATPQKV